MRTITFTSENHSQFLRIEENGKTLVEDTYPTKHAFVINGNTQFAEMASNANITLTAEEQAQVAGYVNTIRQEIGE